MRSILLLVAALALTLGCATTTPITEDQTAAETPASEPTSRTYRLGFWELDLMALDREPRGTTFRFVDIRILKLLEIGSGADYQSLSLVESPWLLNLATTRRDGASYEHRLFDLKGLAAAVFRTTRESAKEAHLHVLKIPILGSLYGRDTEDGVETRTGLYVFRDQAVQ